MNESQLEQLAADRVAAMRDAVPIRPDFQIRVMSAIETAPDNGGTALPGTRRSRAASGADARAPVRRRLVAREFLPAFAVVVFVALLAGGAAWLRWQSHTARDRIPAPKVNAVSLIGVNDIHMMTAQVGWVLNVRDCSGCYPSSILRTTDGGLHWTNTTGALREPLASPGGGYLLPPVAFFLDSTHAWYTEHVQDRIVIHSTADGGLTWQRSKILSFIPANGPKILSLIPANGQISLQFVDPQHGWLTVGIGGIFKTWQFAAMYQTVDGGTSWSSVGPIPLKDRQATVVDLPNRCLKTAVFIDQTRGWASGDCSTAPGAADSGPVFFYRTIDGGRTWSPQALPVPAGYPSNWFDNCTCSVTPVQFPDPQDGAIVVIHDYASQPAGLSMFITHDGGSTWEARSLPKPPTCSLPSFPSADFISGSVGWVMECDAIYRTEDSGSTWTRVYQLPPNGQGIEIDFVDRSNGWAIFENYPGPRPRLYHTSDGGRTWSQ